MQRLKLMITVEEAQNPENAAKAAQLCRWIDNRQAGGNHSDEFMRVNSNSPSNSCTNSSNISADEGFQSLGSTTGDHLDDDSRLDDSDLVEGTREGEDSLVCGEGEEEEEGVPGETDEVPTLRRKRGARKGTKQGPRVTRNLSEEEVIAALQDTCIQFSPWEFYDKVPECRQGWVGGFMEQISIKTPNPKCRL
jgi:hypothetical protein